MTLASGYALISSAANMEGGWSVTASQCPNKASKSSRLIPESPVTGFWMANLRLPSSTHDLDDIGIDSIMSNP